MHNFTSFLHPSMRTSGQLQYHWHNSTICWKIPWRLTKRRVASDGNHDSMILIQIIISLLKHKNCQLINQLLINIIELPPRCFIRVLRFGGPASAMAWVLKKTSGALIWLRDARCYWSVNHNWADHNQLFNTYPQAETLPVPFSLRWPRELQWLVN